MIVRSRAKAPEGPSRTPKPRESGRLISHIVAILIALALAGYVPPTGFIVYGDFQEGCTGDRFEVACGWESLKPWLLMLVSPMLHLP